MCAGRARNSTGTFASCQRYRLCDAGVAKVWRRQSSLINGLTELQANLFFFPRIGIVILGSHRSFRCANLNSESRLETKSSKSCQYMMTLLRQFDGYRIVHVCREFNRLADRLSNQVSMARPTCRAG